MKFRLSRHAEWKLMRPGIPLSLVQSMEPVSVAGFTNRVYGSKMGKCIYYGSW